MEEKLVYTLYDIYAALDCMYARAICVRGFFTSQSSTLTRHLFASKIDIEGQV
jgi:hypothetical protein